MAEIWAMDADGSDKTRLPVQVLRLGLEPSRVVSRRALHRLLAGTGDGIEGGSGADTIDGGPGPNLLEGGDGKDVISGGSGGGFRKGGSGKDTLRGGKGRRRCEAPPFERSLVVRELPSSFRSLNPKS